MGNLNTKMVNKNTWIGNMLLNVCCQKVVISHQKIRVLKLLWKWPQFMKLNLGVLTKKYNKTKLLSLVEKYWQVQTQLKN